MVLLVVNDNGPLMSDRPWYSLTIQNPKTPKRILKINIKDGIN
jgi:hypothetical protein